MIGDSKTEEKREWRLIKVHKDMYFLGFFSSQTFLEFWLFWPPCAGVAQQCCWAGFWGSSEQGCAKHCSKQEKGLLGITSFSVQMQTLPPFREVSCQRTVMWLQLLPVPCWIILCLLFDLFSHWVTGSMTAMWCSDCRLHCLIEKWIASEPSVYLLSYFLLKLGKLGFPCDFEAQSSDVQWNPVSVFIHYCFWSLLPLSQMFFETSFSRYCIFSLEFPSVGIIVQ